MPDRGIVATALKTGERTIPQPPISIHSFFTGQVLGRESNSNEGSCSRNSADESGLGVLARSAAKM